MTNPKRRPQNALISATSILATLIALASAPGDAQDICSEAIGALPDCGMNLVLRDDGQCEDLWVGMPNDDDPARQPVGTDTDIDPGCNGGTDLFYMYVLPDTQHYAQFYEGLEQNSEQCARHMYCQAQGIANDFLADSKVKFATHVGDVIQNENDNPQNDPEIQADQWQFAIDTYTQFFGVGTPPNENVPHSISIGNHDFDDFNKLPLSDVDCFVENFGRQRYVAAGVNWLENTPLNLATEANMAQIFTGTDSNMQPVDFLHISLEHYAPDDAVEWAQRVLNANRELPTILTTHSYSTISGSRNQSSTAINNKGSNLDGGGDNAGEEIHQKLTYLFPQIFMAVSGHVSGNGIARAPNFITDQFVGEEETFSIIEHLADYQGLTQRHPTAKCDEGGLMHKLRFRADEIEFDTVTFSGMTFAPDATGCFRCAGIDLDQWRQHLDPTARRTFRFRQDYATNVRDTYLDESLPNDNSDTELDVQIVASGPTAGEKQGLIAFDDLFGTSSGQIPTGLEIEKAVLTLTFEGGFRSPFAGASTLCEVQLHRMLTTWQADDTWNTLVAGVSIDDVEAKSTATATILPCDPIGNCENYPNSLGDWRGTRSFDVTDDVVQWYADYEVDPLSTSNQGWALLMDTAFCEGLNFEPSDLPTWFRASDWNETVTELPTLTVSVVPPA